ncbi:MAG: hypothetical protein PUF37_07750 [Prevotellaceae bacterium]|nr:hypothetical protein [Prevotellaceae bacterium]
MSFQISLKKALAAAAVMLSPAVAWAGFTTSNTAEHIMIAGPLGQGQGIVNKISDETNTAENTALIQAGMYPAQAQMASWEKKRVAYLESSNFGEAISNACTLYIDGVRTLQALWMLQESCKINPQGLGSMTTVKLFLQTGFQLYYIYRVLNTIIPGKGSKNRLSGAERMKLLWSLNDQLNSLNTKLHNLSYSILVSSYIDVWNDAITGMKVKTHGQLAMEAMERGMRGMKNSWILHKKKEHMWGKNLIP